MRRHILHSVSLTIVAFMPLMAALWVIPAQAQSTTRTCSYNPDGSITCTIEGGGEDGGGGGGTGGGACTPGDHLEYRVLSYDAAAGMCRLSPVWVDNCTGQVIETAGNAVDDVPCQMPEPPSPSPCDTFSVSNGGITCGTSRWQVQARVSFPKVYLDVRPYPATLVRWPTAIRNGGLPESSGSAGVDYIPYGGGCQAAREWVTGRICG